VSEKICETPFRHAVIDGFLSAEVVSRINAEWPDDWDKEDGSYQNKWNTQDLPSTAQAVTDSIDIARIERITGITGLMPDPDLCGAGLHCIPRGGFLKMHCDFNAHPNGWHRRVNVLIYLNEIWEKAWGGYLSLGKAQQKEIAPIGGRCVIFETNENTWHGHPEPLACPDNKQRRSLALYYYTKEPPAEPPHSTVYVKNKKK